MTTGPATTNRQTGRTTRLLEDARRLGAVFVVPWEAMRRAVRSKAPDVHVIATTNPESLELRGCSHLVFDHTMDEFFPSETAQMRRLYNK